MGLRVIFLQGCQGGLSCEGNPRARLKEVRETIMWISGGKAFRAGGTDRAEGLRSDGADVLEGGEEPPQGQRSEVPGAWRTLQMKLR